MENPVNSLQKMLDVNIPIVYIDDYDFARIDEIISKACGSDIVEWNPATGVTNFLSKCSIRRDASLNDFLAEKYADDIESVKPDYIVLREIASYLDDPQTISLLTHIAQRKLYDREYDTSIIISDYGLTIPNQLLPYTSILNIDIPDESDIERLIEEHLEANDVDKEKFTDKDREALMPSLRGLSSFEIDRVLDMAISVNGTLSDKDKEMILQQKKAQVKKSGLIELIDVKESLDDIGGLNKLKDYLKDKEAVS